ncbi:hypothetical protein PV325_005586 [Microctonus aethiopoides]|uniref:RNA polymerase II subunit B1 CTD phosphatase RPAP2 homolog n=2 Tax=Microctonus aethiopoides TaxID=144406 RepID=A0AA39KXB3_9HYME|nr:hypothetical protein PV325_005586 [Microctonus aethiopoides]KAK0177204.1 hypothetical protein PV328_001281 [Microctonus aethiopoides]
MNVTSTKNQRTNRANRIKAAKAAKNVPTAILLKKKAECDAKALKIVEHLVEPMVEVEWLLQNLGQINRSHLEDVAEERAIVKLCGYVLCNNPLTKIVNKKYQISTLKNKVYDVEKVKNFCSYLCYSAMEHLMIQMFTSPLWLRSEEEIPEFTILPRSERNIKCPPGVEVNILGVELPDDDDDEVTLLLKEQNKSDTKLGESTKSPIQTPNYHPQNIEFNQVSLNKKDEIICNEKNNQSIDEEPNDILFKTENSNCTKSNLQLSKNTSSLKSTEIVSEPDVEAKLSLMENPTKVTVDQSKIHETSQLPVNNSKSVETCRKFNSKNKTNIRTKSTASFESLTTRIEQSFTEWVTQDTINLLHGEETDKKQIIDNITRQEKYTALCRKLNHIQLKEEKEERSAATQLDDLKPAPHFSVLKEEAKNLEVKVRSFYKGKMNIPIPEQDNKKSDEIQETENNIPLMDAHDPRALRRRIFLDKLNKILPDLLSALIGHGKIRDVYNFDKTTGIKTLISTFDLSATNIVFRTAEWTLVGLIIIKMLGIIDPAIKSLLLTKKATMYIAMILMTFKLDSNYLDYLINSRTKPLKINCYDSTDDSE